MPNPMMEGLSAFIECWNDENPEGPKVPTRNELCWTCNGNGTQALHGLDVTDLVHEDPDFLPEYLSGMYDTVCESCNGAKVLTVFDETSASDEMKEQWNSWMEELYTMRAIEAQERAMGA